VEIKIGVQHVTRELVLDIDESADALEQKLGQAISGAGMLTLTDTKGRRVLVPAAHLAYIEVGGGVTGQVGFRS
jgi:hypothetical protein